MLLVADHLAALHFVDAIFIGHFGHPPVHNLLEIAVEYLLTLLFWRVLEEVLVDLAKHKVLDLLALKGAHKLHFERSGDVREIKAKLF